MEETWRDEFRITEEEENYFDKNHSDHINRYINANINKIKAFPTVNLSRINTENYHTRKVTLEEIKGLIRITKKKTPRSTKVNKEILLKCTDKALKQLKNIFNACISIG